MSVSRWPPFSVEDLAPPSFASRRVHVSVFAIGAHLLDQGLQLGALGFRHGVVVVEMGGAFATIGKSLAHKIPS